MDGIKGYTGNRIQCQQFSAFDPFQEIDPMESYVSFEEHQQYLSADHEHVKCFFAWNSLEETEGEGTLNDTYYIVSRGGRSGLRRQCL